MLTRTMILLLMLIAAQIVSAQSCYDNISATTPTSRFVDNKDGTVSDTFTGLMWKRCAEGMNWNNTTCTGNASSFNWSSALQRVNSINQNDGGYAGKTDWRLPNIKELASIVEIRCNNPAINLVIFPNTPVYVWSGSPFAGDSDGAWDVSFGYGYVNWGSRGSGFAVRLLRERQ